MTEAGTMNDDEIEIDLSEVDPEAEEEPIDWSLLDDPTEDEEPIAPFVSATTSWGELDARAILAGEVDEDPPELLLRDDGPALLYRGRVHSVAGEPESGKSWFAILACVQAMADGHHAVYVDFEDSPKSVFARLRNLGVPSSLVIEKFHYIRPEMPLKWDGQNQSWLDFLSTLKRSADAQGGLGVVIFDGITEALSLQGILGKDNEDVAGWFGAVPRRIAHATHAAVLLVDHVTKDPDGRGRYPIGAQAKLAALDGCQFTTTMQMQFARGRSGVVRIGVTKDRPGFVRAVSEMTKAHAVVADLVITALEEDGQLRLTLTKPDIQANPDGTVKPSQVQNDITRILKRRHDGMPKTELLQRLAVRAVVKNQAIGEMIDHGWLIEFKDGRTKMVKLGTPQDAKD